MKNKIIYIIVIALSIAYIIMGNKIVTKNSLFFSNASGEQYRKAKVTHILNDKTTQDELSSDKEVRKIVFAAEIYGDYSDKGETVLAEQTIDQYSVLLNPIKVGDKLFIYKSEDVMGNVSWYPDEEIKLDKLICLGIIFVIFLVIFGRTKGINTIISLTFTCLSIFMVYIPAILSGYNIYILSIITSIYIIVMTLLIIMGINKKCLVSGLGCISGVIAVALLTLLMTKVLNLTGITDEDSIYLLYLNESNPIDLKAVIFGAIVIGAIGAIMDVSISIASSLKEVFDSSETPTFKSIYKSGINIGKDMMGTMANTLVLAYIGSSLSLVLLLCAYNDSVAYLLNKEMIIVEILQALVGSFGILLTIPLTTVISAIIYMKDKKKR